jgi:hypothetical protein
MKATTMKKVVELCYGRYRLFVFGAYGTRSLSAYIEAANTLKSDFPNINDTDIAIGTIRNTGYIDHYQVVSALLPGSNGIEEAISNGYELSKDFDW